jgi:hypothetical protein
MHGTTKGFTRPSDFPAVGKRSRILDGSLRELTRLGAEFKI